MDLFGRESRIRLELVREQLAEKGRLLDGAIALLHERDKEIADLRRRLADTQPKQQTMTSYPLYLGEQEEDLRWQLDQGMINTAEFSQLMKELDFQNTEIELDIAPVGSDFSY